MACKIKRIDIRLFALLLVVLVQSAVDTSFFLLLFHYFPSFIDDKHLTIDGVTAIIAVLVFLARTIVMVLGNYVQNNIVFSYRADLSTQLLADSVKLTNHNFSVDKKLNKKLTVDVDILINQFLIPVVYSVSESIILLAILAVLLYTSGPIILATILVFVPIGYLYLKLTRRILSSGAERRENADTSRLALVRDVPSLQGALITQPSVILYLLRKFRSLTLLSCMSWVAVYTISNSSRFVIEFISVVTVGSAIMIYGALNSGVLDIASLLIVFGVAVLRLLPSISRLSHYQQMIRYTSPLVAQYKRPLLRALFRNEPRALWEKES